MSRRDWDRENMKRNPLRFGWKEVGEVWYLFVVLLLIGGCAVYIIKAKPCKYDQTNTIDATIQTPIPSISVTCSKDIEDRQCAGMVSPECEPECHGACTKASKKAETTKTAQFQIEAEIERIGNEER